MTIAVNPEALQWAVRRSGASRKKLEKKFADLPKWESDELRPTYAQAKKFAKEVHVPFIRLYMPPPEESPVIPDFRVVGGKKRSRMSVELIDTIYACQNRQAWYRDFAISNGMPKLEFVGSATISVPPKEAAEDMRRILGFDMKEREEQRKTANAMQLLIRKMDEIGVLVMINGVVKNNNSRPLEVDEFRGFALSDDYAPVVFVNSRDAEVAQILTLAHELAHIWIGSSGLTNMEIESKRKFPQEEVWCNAVAAELLVPEAELRKRYKDDDDIRGSVTRLASTFGVSKRVILIRMLNAKLISKRRFDSECKLTPSTLSKARGGRSGGGENFHRTLAKRVGHRFANAIVSSTLEGTTLHRDALRLLGISSVDTLMKFGRHVEIVK